MGITATGVATPRPGSSNEACARACRSAAAGHPLTETGKARNKKWSLVRAFVEHSFHVIKRLWGFVKVRYRGLAKNTVRVFALLALANLYRVHHLLLPQDG